MGFFDRLLKRSSGQGNELDVDFVIERMRSLACEGRYIDAVDYAQPHALRSGDPRLNHELVEYRRRAAVEAIACAQARPDWPPVVVDPFPGLVGIPEVSITDLTPEVMQGAILHHGSLIIRGAVPREEAIRMTSGIDQAFASFDAAAAGTATAQDAAWWSGINLGPEDHAMAHSRGWTHADGGILAADSPVLFNRLADLYRQRGIAQVIEAHLGERPVLSMGKAVLRRTKPTNPGDFHQDGAFLGRVRTINTWMALTDCGEDSPGLEIVDCRVPRIVETGTEDASFEWSTGRTVALRANGGRPFARPLFQAGDAIMFDELMLHATSYAPTMTHTRYAIEAWFFAPSAHAEKQIPLLL